MKSLHGITEALDPDITAVAEAKLYADRNLQLQGYN